MTRLHVVTYVNYETLDNQVVGVFDELQPAIKAAEQFYIDICYELAIQPTPHSPLLYKLKKADGHDAGYVEINNCTLQSEFFPTVLMHRDDLKQKGFDADNIDDETCRAIASKTTDYLFDGDYWTCLAEAAEFYNIPRKED